MTLPKQLMILEVSRKQAYIFSSKKLRDNADRSGDIHYVTSTEFFQKAAPTLYQEDQNMVYSGGGHTVLQFDDPNTARQFATVVTETVLRRYHGLELFVKQIPYDANKTPGENLKELSASLERKKARREHAFHRLSFGVEELHEQTYLPKQKNASNPPSQEGLNAPKGWKFAQTFSQITGKNDPFLAVVHLDGNAMGKRVDGIYDAASNDWEACRAKLDLFSRSIQEQFEDAFQEMAAHIAKSKTWDDQTLPLRPVILAGDDVCFVTRGSIGLECARIMLECLAKRANAADGLPYAACAGVVLVHEKYPFHRAYDLSEDLCHKAKTFGVSLRPDGTISAMDWHIEFGQMKDTLSDLRKDYQTDDGKRLELRPVTVLLPDGMEHTEESDLRSYSFFKAMCLAVQKERSKNGKDKIARSKIKGLRVALKQGELETQYFKIVQEITGFPYQEFQALYCDDADRMRQYNRIRKIDSEFQEWETFKVLGSTPRSLFFDAVEMSDHFEEVRT